MTVVQPRSSRLAHFQQQIAAENANLDVANALDAIGTLPTPPRQHPLTVGLIASGEVVEDFENNAHVVRLSRAHWAAELAASPVDLVFVETDYSCLDEWRRDLFDESLGDNQLVAMARFCLRQAIPCALCVTLQGSQTALLDHLFADFPSVLAVEETTYAALRARFGGQKVRRFLPFVDGSRFHPAGLPPGEHGLPPNALPVVADCLSTLMYQDGDSAQLNVLQRTLAHKVWLYESQDHLRPRESYLPAHLLRRSLGSLSARASCNILKVSDLSIVLESASHQSYWGHHRKVLKAMAAKSLALSTTMDEGLFGPALAAVAERFLRAADGPDLAAKLGDLLTKRLLRERLQHLFFRQVALSHTLQTRLETLGATLGRPVGTPAPWQPKVSVIAVTNRPENFAFLMGRYRDQTYANKELILVVNTDTVGVEALRRQLRESDNARVLGVPARWPIGVCLNAGIAEAQGAFWAKFDDDDVYGPAYLADYVLNARFVDFDIAGKADIFTYDERGDRTVLRRSNEHPHRPGSAFAGGTLFVKHTPGELVFQEHARGFVDIWFQWQHLAEGKMLYASDPFNFMQIRRADRRTHTWRVEVAEMGDAEDVGPGLAVEAAIV